MAQPLTAPLPLDVDLSDLAIIRCIALAPATGATVSGVTISAMVITGSQDTGAGSGGVDVTVPKIAPDYFVAMTEG